MPPFSHSEEREERGKAVIKISRHAKAGFSTSLAERPALRLCGPLNKLFDLQGNPVMPTSRLHPLGPKPGRKIVDWLDHGHSIDIDMD